MSPLRVIAGRAKGRLLRMPPETTRPTSHKVRGAVFSMLEAQLHQAGDTGWEGLRVLDLFAGSGALGIEALSRGATWADFVEHDARACRVIGDNLGRSGFADRAKVHCCDGLSYVRRGESRALPYAIIFADPPYGYPQLEQVLAELGARGPEGGVGFVVVESGLSDAPPDGAAGLRLLRQRRHGDTVITLFLWQQARQGAQV